MDSIAHPIAYDFHDPNVIADPYPTYARMRREQPIWRNPVSGSWTITRYQDVRRVLDGSEFSNTRFEELFQRLPPDQRSQADPLRTILEPRLLFTEGDRHHRLRSLLMKGFTPDHLQTYSGLIAERLELLLRDLPEGKPIDFLQRVCALLPGMVILALLGIRVEEQEKMRGWTDDIYAWIGHFPGSILERTHKALTAMDGLRDRLKAYIAEVRSSPRADLISVLVHAEDEGQFLNEAELIANLIGLVNAGQETTGCLLANGLLRLLQFPDPMKRLRAEPKLAATAVEEMLRFDAPAQFIARRVTSKLEIEGTNLEPGAMIAVGLGSANRDESVFPKADTFDVTREPNPHVAFGHGRHYCLGQALARLEANAFFTVVLRRFREIIPAWEGPTPEWRPTLSFRSPRTLPVIVRS